MTSVDNLGRRKQNEESYPYKDDFLDYYQKHRPPGSIPQGYNFQQFVKMGPGARSIPDYIYGEVEKNKFSQYRQSQDEAHDTTLSPANSITEDDNCETELQHANVSQKPGKMKIRH